MMKKTVFTLPNLRCQSPACDYVRRIKEQAGTQAWTRTRPLQDDSKICRPNIADMDVPGASKSKANKKQYTRNNDQRNLYDDLTWGSTSIRKVDDVDEIEFIFDLEISIFYIFGINKIT